MEKGLRKEFKEQYTEVKYRSLLEALNSKHPGAIEFRIAETPVFVPRQFSRKMFEACDHIINFISDPAFKSLTERSILPGVRVPNENNHPHMISFDFGVCINDRDELEPQLIEMQGFPTLYAFQVYFPELLKQFFQIPPEYSQYLGDYTEKTYLEDLREVIVGPHNPENVILLEIKPHEQKTRIDFYCTQDYFGIKSICLTELIQEGRKLFYKLEGKKVRVLRIYNRVIFDELQAHQSTLGKVVDITQELDVEWVPHPNWFYRISKFTLPFIRHPFVPETFFLNDVKQLPGDLRNFVLKPLFSFAGQGVVIDVSEEDINRIQDPENWILQRKVQYADVIETPDIPAKVEIRLMYLWKDGDKRPKAATNLARLSKGKMIGVRYNKDKEWVGGSVGFFEREDFT